jgi:hypothetical protein
MYLVVNEFSKKRSNINENSFDAVKTLTKIKDWNAI